MISEYVTTSVLVQESCHTEGANRERGVITCNRL